MKRARLILIVAGAGAMLSTAAALRPGGPVAAELASPLFTSPVQARLAADRRIAAGPQDGAQTDLSELALRIDGGEEGFGHIVDVVPSPGGDTIYVLDGMSLSGSAFDSGGTRLFGFGGAGGGPGEFRRPTSLTLLPWSGEVAVWDVQTQRMTVHTSAGAPVRSLSPAGLGQGLVQRMAAVEGGFVAEVRSDPLRVQPDAQGGALVRLDTAARATRTLLRFRVPGVNASHRESAAGSSVTTWLNPLTWSPEPRWSALRDGSVVFAPGGPDDVYRIDPSGRVERIRADFRPARVTRGDRVRHLAGLRERGKIAASTTPLHLLEPLNRSYYARVRPAVSGVLAGPGGAVWTRGFSTEDDWRGYSREWRVAAAARPPARVRLPRGFEPLHIAGSLVYGVAVDSMLAERVEAYRVEVP
ncbi:hypothetical protein [Longimicrobium terrae]|uniref:6-bladed beta-propeller n=1 Tax=Longimicrobium terrae TaxID=1639882 RepID=A0A841H150_9BACT|nr:hypothetical protein [Longimicrobium terrae]MBB4637296.1 hypothetical protein [Longimicrobium terrae]MBB6071694.1 hypothetical protein [Longimicrobium terrae]NNC28455.1 hypothetical protein [Longimicrobium terrae]